MFKTFIGPIEENLILHIKTRNAQRIFAQFGNVNQQ